MYKLKDFFPTVNIKEVEIRSFNLRVYVRVTIDRSITEKIYREVQYHGGYNIKLEDKIISFPVDVVKDFCHLQIPLNKQLVKDRGSIEAGNVYKEYLLPEDIYGRVRD